MLKINIETTQYSAEDMAEMLNQIADSLNSGFTSGYYPTWSLEKIKCETCGGTEKVDTFTSEGEPLGDKPCPDCTNVDDADFSGSNNEDR